MAILCYVVGKAVQLALAESCDQPAASWAAHSSIVLWTAQLEQSRWARDSCCNSAKRRDDFSRTGIPQSRCYPTLLAQRVRFAMGRHHGQLCIAQWKSPLRRGPRRPPSPCPGTTPLLALSRLRYRFRDVASGTDAQAATLSPAALVAIRAPTQDTHQPETRVHP